MRIISERHRELHVEWHRYYDDKRMAGCGFAFDCTEEGFIVIPSDNDAAWENYRKCVDGTYDVIDRGVQKAEWHYTVPAVGECEVCGREVVLESSDYNECDGCGAFYSLFGQRYRDDLLTNPDYLQDDYGYED